MLGFGHEDHVLRVPRPPLAVLSPLLGQIGSGGDDRVPPAGWRSWRLLWPTRLQETSGGILVRERVAAEGLAGSDGLELQNFSPVPYCESVSGSPC